MNNLKMNNSYVLGIVGSRHYMDYEGFCGGLNQIVSLYGKPSKVVSGGHTDKRGNIKPGADTLAWRWAQDNNIEMVEHDAKWDLYGKAAGAIRNKLIVDDIDVLLAFVAPNSTGTRITINMAKKNPAIKIYVINIT